jgi:hypothetical protein
MNMNEVDYINEDDGTEIEIENSEDEMGLVEPFNPAQIRVSPKYMTIDLLLSRIEHQELDLSPDFQRKFVWTDGAQSRLIESTLIRLPLPAFYMDATDDDKWLVIDGLQRLTSLKRFVLTRELKLSGLEFLGQQLNGKIYDELSPAFQRRIKETQVTVYLIEKGTPPKVKFNIFKRINTGGLPLSFQEIRHALNPGAVTTYLADLAESNEFKKATTDGVRDQRMGDREIVLRFLAFAITPYTQYKVPDLDSFLNDKMAEINKMTEERRQELRQRFFRAMDAAYHIFENDAFRKRYNKTAKRLSINKALFEAWAVNLDRLDDQQLLQLTQYKEIVKEKFIALMNIPEFEKAISQGTNTIAKVKYRFEAIAQLIDEVLKSTEM